MQPSLKTMQIHYENKHPKENWAEAEQLYNQEEEIDEAEEYEKYEESAYEEANQENQGEKKEEPTEGEKKEEWLIDLHCFILQLQTNIITPPL